MYFLASSSVTTSSQQTLPTPCSDAGWQCPQPSTGVRISKIKAWVSYIIFVELDFWPLIATHKLQLRKLVTYNACKWISTTNWTAELIHISTQGKESWTFAFWHKSLTESTSRITARKKAVWGEERHWSCQHLVFPAPVFNFCMILSEIKAGSPTLLWESFSPKCPCSWQPLHGDTKLPVILTLEAISSTQVRSSWMPTEESRKPALHMERRGESTKEMADCHFVLTQLIRSFLHLVSWSFQSP